MAVWEARRQVTAAKWGNVISQVSWTWWTTQDVYYWQANSFQYARNINTDDELHGIKLSNKSVFVPYFAKSQLTSMWNNGVIALRTDWMAKPIVFNETNFISGWTSQWDEPTPQSWHGVCPWVVFQDYFWFATYNEQTWEAAFCARNVGSWSTYICSPYDHTEATDESISDPTGTITLRMKWPITAILNYNNTRLVVAAWNDIWVYYPELDQSSPVTHEGNTIPSSDYGKTGWKKTLTYEAWVTIVWLTASFEYLKVRCVDEWWNTQIYFYQGNNDLRNTFVYNLVDLPCVRVTRVYNINGVDYYVSSIDWTDWFVNLYKLVWTTPVELFKQRAWLSVYDTQYKAPYFVWPTSLWAAYRGGKFYIWDAYGLFQFTYSPNGIDTGYMKWRLKDEESDQNPRQIYWVCLNKSRLYVSTEDWCYMMYVIDTGKPPITPTAQQIADLKNTYHYTDDDIEWMLEWGYQKEWVLISREYEWNEWGTVTKMLDEVRMNFELNQLTQYNWTIDVYVSPNNLWKNANSFTKANNWYHVMHITQDSAWTRAEKSNLFNDLQQWESAFKFDWQTITYAIVITRWTETKATPIVRELRLTYHCKDKTNNVYDIN